jgi:hypothetical protein
MRNTSSKPAARALMHVSSDRERNEQEQLGTRRA